MPLRSMPTGGTSKAKQSKACNPLLDPEAEEATVVIY